MPEWEHTCNIILIQYHTTLCTLFMIIIIEKQPELSSNYKDEGHCPMTTTPNTLPVIKNDFGIYGFASLLYTSWISLSVFGETNIFITASQNLSLSFSCYRQLNASANYQPNISSSFTLYIPHWYLLS